MKKTQQILATIISFIIITFFVGSAHAQTWTGDYTITDSGDIAPLSGYTEVTGSLTIGRDPYGATPTTLTLKAGAGFFNGETYTVSAQDGSASATLESGVDGWYVLGNLVFGGLLGYLIIDPATGAMFTLPEEPRILKFLTFLRKSGSRSFGSMHSRKVRGKVMFDTTTSE